VTAPVGAAQASSHKRRLTYAATRMGAVGDVGGASTGVGPSRDPARTHCVTAPPAWRHDSRAGVDIIAALGRFCLEAGDEFIGPPDLDNEDGDCCRPFSCSRPQNGAVRAGRKAATPSRTMRDRREFEARRERGGVGRSRLERSPPCRRGLAGPAEVRSVAGPALGAGWRRRAPKRDRGLVKLTKR
jgi:hypothetical protein